MTSDPPMISVADAKARFSELIDRVSAGETFVVSRRGRAALALVRPSDETAPRVPTTGLAGAVGVFSDLDDFAGAIEEVIRNRAAGRDRAVPAPG